MNSRFELRKTSLNDAYLIIPFSVDDNRGNFVKDFHRDFFENNKLDFDISETFHCLNNSAKTIRGMHFAYKDPQTKIVECITGEIYDVIVDLRKNSSTYLKWEAFVLSEENKLSLYVPKGFAHGYLTLKPGIVFYKCCGKYNPENDSGVHFMDKSFAINWPIKDFGEVIISDKDSHLKTYEEMKDLIEY